jgi:hypothetical protein
MGLVCIMLSNAKIFARWWAEAWAYSKMVENLLPFARHPGVIPEEKFMGKKQDVGHICVWGCIAFVCIPGEKNGGELEDRGQKGWLVGMEGCGIHRVLVLKTGQIIRSWNVVFKEGIGHCMLIAEGEYFADNEDNIDLNYEFLTENSFVHASQTPTETPAETAETPAKTTQVEKSCPRIIYPSASHKSAYIQGSTGTMDTIPIIEQDNNHNENDMALAINISSEPLNRFVPSTFREAFDITQQHLWMPAIENEIE